jgi:hypothetical protein
MRAHAEGEQLQEIADQSEDGASHRRRPDDTARSCHGLSGQIVSATKCCGVQVGSDGSVRHELYVSRGARWGSDGLASRRYARSTDIVISEICVVTVRAYRVNIGAGALVSEKEAGPPSAAITAAAAGLSSANTAEGSTRAKWTCNADPLTQQAGDYQGQSKTHDATLASRCCRSIRGKQPLSTRQQTRRRRCPRHGRQD